MNVESSIAIIWLLPVFVQIILPLIMLLFYVSGKLFAGALGFSPREEKAVPIHGAQEKSELPTAGAMA